MVQCSCGKVMDKVPAWLTGVQVEFVCNNCPKRQVKNITQVSFETGRQTPSEELEELGIDETELDEDE